MTNNEFREWCNENLCTDWRKMDRNGDSNYPPLDDRNKNYNDNIQGLLELP